MSNNSGNYRSHKRQKSSVSSGAYYFPPENELQASYEPPHTSHISGANTNDLYNVNFKYPNKDSSARSSLISSGDTSSQIGYQSSDIWDSSIRNSSSAHSQNVPYNLSQSIQLQSTGYSYNELPTIVMPQHSSISLDTNDCQPQYIQNSTYKGRDSYSSSTGNELTNSYPPQYHSPSKNFNRKQVKQHQKNNLSISSHFNLFSLNEENLKNNFIKTEEKEDFVSNMPNVPRTASFTQFQNYPNVQNIRNMHNAQDVETVQNISSETGVQNIPVLQSTQISTKTSDIKDAPIELFSKLYNIDGSNLSNYLLEILHFITIPVPLDDFYNLLYNNEDMEFPFPKTEFSERIDKTIIGLDNKPSLQLLNQVLIIFRSPDLLLSYFPDLESREIKLLNINYHELLRTFLAIKILSDVLIEVKGEDPAKLQNHIIPRLSIYKVYFIICQKLIIKYPSTSNTTNEQQKLILGRSKLGKLIKLVYPQLLIKRLGSRGESKYNYLGVMWNQDIVNSETIELSEKLELNELSEMFDSSNLHSRSLSVVSNSSQFSKSKPRSRKSSIKNIDSDKEVDYTNPNLSFITSSLKYPNHSQFGILPSDSHLNWFDEVKTNIYSQTNWISSNLITDLLFNDELMSNNRLLIGLMTGVIHPILNETPVERNIDLKLYLLILVEISPYLLLVKTSSHNFLKRLRLNVLHFINQYIQELSRYNHSGVFKISNAVTFLVLLKKLLNLNDLELTFLKFFNDENKRSLMSLDIKNFLESNFDPLLHFSSLRPSVNICSSKPISFKDEVLSKDLIDSLIGFNFDPTRINQQSNISLNYILQEIEIIDVFFKTDLVHFLSTKTNTSIDPQIDFFSSSQRSQLMELIGLVENKLLSEHFKSKYPILVFNTYINLIFNDILKFVFFKDQSQDLISDVTKENNSSFRYFWVFHSLIQELLSLFGEIVGLHDTISSEENN